MSQNQHFSRRFKVCSINLVFDSPSLNSTFNAAPRDEVNESTTSQMIYVGIMIAVLLFLIVAAFTSYRCRKMRSFNQVKYHSIPHYLLPSSSELKLCASFSLLSLFKSVIPGFQLDVTQIFCFSAAQ